MRKITFLCLISLIVFGLSSCKKEDPVDNSVKNLQLSFTKDGNVISLSASADNALNFAWDFANGEKGTGANVDAVYSVKGTYWVKCSASNSTSQQVDSIEVDPEGDPEVYNEVARTLCGFNSQTNESSAVWYWASGADYMLFGGAKSYSYERLDSAEYSLFDPIATGGDIWWQESGPSKAQSLNDAYSFKLNQEMNYTCDYKEDGFCLNWAYAFYRHNMNTSQYVDTITNSVPTNGSWKIHTYAHADYQDYPGIVDAPMTRVNGREVDTAYFLETKGGTWLFQEIAEPKYQILSITQDSVFVRWEVGLPADFQVDKTPPWDYPQWLSPGDGEWQYAYLVKTESQP